MAVTDTIEINGEEREIADAYAREQCAANAQNIATNAEGITGLNNNLAQLEIDLKMLGYTVPKKMPVQNYVDSDGIFHQRVGRVDLGSIDWEQGGDNNKTSWVPTSWKGDYKIPTDQGLKAKIYCSKYTIDSATNVEKQANDKTIAINTSGWVYIYDSAFVSATASEFKASLKGVYLYYELAEEKTINVDGNEAVVALKSDLGGLSFSASGTTLTITDGTNTWSLTAN